MQITLEPIKHIYFSRNKGENIASYEQILMRENGKNGYPIATVHIDLFWKDGLKDIHDKLSDGETVMVELDFKMILE